MLLAAAVVIVVLVIFCVMQEARIAELEADRRDDANGHVRRDPRTGRFTRAGDSK